MALKDYIESVKLKTSYNNIVNNSINGKTFVANFGNPYFEFEIKSIPMTRTTFYDNFQDLYLTENSSKIEKNMLPILGNTTNQIVFGDSFLKVYSTTSAGATSFQIQGFINGEDEQYDYVSGQLVAGDLITFSNQKKIYMVTNTVPVGSLSATTVNIFPPLLTALTTSPQTTVNVTNISAQVKSTNDVVEYSIGTENYYVFEQNFREVL